MSKTMVIIDTSIYLNILGVPNKSQECNQVYKDFKELIELGTIFVLPMATILETGNHIAQNGDGNQRREIAQKFCAHIEQVLNNEAPFTISHFPTNDEIKNWLNQFPNLAMRNKSSDKQEGMSFGDFTIIQEWEKQKLLHKNYEIWIWSLDQDLQNPNYHHYPKNK